MTHRKRQVRRSLGTRLFVLMAAMVMLLAGCVMPDGTVYTIPLEVLPADVGAGTSIIDAEEDAPSTDKPSPADPYIAAGREYGEAGDLEAALAEFDQAIAADSNAALAYYFRAMTYARLGDFGAAMADIERAITLAPNDVDSLLLRARLFWETGDVAAAAADYDRVLTLTNGGEGLDQATQVEAHFARAVDHYSKGDLTATSVDIAAVLRINPWNTDFYPEYSRFVQSAAIFEAKVAEYDAMAAAAPSPGSAAYAEGMKHLLRAQLLAIPEEYDAAVVELTAAIEADPDLAAAYHARGVARIQTAKYPRNNVASHAEKDGMVTYTDPVTGEEVTKSQEEYDSILAAAVEKVETMRSQGIEDLTHALELDPTLVEAVHDLGVAHFVYEEQQTIGFVHTTPDENGRDKALELFDQAVKADPEWEQARLSRMLASLHWGIQDSIADETSTNTNVLLETARDDAEFLIARDAGEGWPYYVRFALAFQSVGYDSNKFDEDTGAQLEVDFATIRRLSPNLNIDDLSTEAILAVRLSGPMQSPSPLLVSRIEGEAGEQVLVHADAGFKIQIPIQEARQKISEISVPDGPIQIVMSSDFRTYQLLIYEADLGDLSVEQWLTEEMSRFGVADIELLDTYVTDYGEATIFAIPGFQMAVLPIGKRVYFFSHARSEMWSGVLGGDSDSRPETLTSFIDGFSLLDK